MTAIWDGVTRMLQLIGNLFEVIISSNNPIFQTITGMFFLSFFLAIIMLFFDTKDD